MTRVESFEDLRKPVLEYLVPAIEKAVEVCRKSFHEDEFNDNWVFGTHLWKNTWNRFKALVDFEDCPFDIYGKANEYKLKIGDFVVRHHRIDTETQIPNGAKAVKAAAFIQMELFDQYGKGVSVTSKDNIVIAIVADAYDGLREIFIGELLPNSIESKQYYWAKKISVYLAEGVNPLDIDFIQFRNFTNHPQFAPEEEIPEVPVVLEKNRIVKPNEK
jgi:hypothetical protein